MPEDAIASNLAAVSANMLKVDYGLASRTVLQKVQQELVTKDVKQWVSSELQKTELRGKLDTLKKTHKTEKKENSKG